jgi:hypothetical protein
VSSSYKKIKKGEERKQHDVVEGDARMCDMVMDPAAADERQEEKKSEEGNFESGLCYNGKW